MKGIESHNTKASFACIMQVAWTKDNINVDRIINCEPKKGESYMSPSNDSQDEIEIRFNVFFRNDDSFTS